MNWNSEMFSTIGYLSVIFWIAAAVLCLLYWKFPSRILCTIILALTVAGFFGARINSEEHVNRIQPDRTEELEKRAAQERARQKALLDSRGEEVAQVRFAEDGAGDYLDQAGMDEADLKYFKSQGLDTPAWKQQKKKRSGAGADDDSIESAIGGEDVIAGVQDDTFVEDEETKPIIMLAADMAMAHRLDILNLRTSLIMLIVAIVMIVFDYLRRANIHGESSFPLPLPSKWLNAITPMQPLLSVDKRSTQSLQRELSRLAHRGDSFVYLTDDPSRASILPLSLPKLPLLAWREDLIPVTEEVDDEFIFESAWYGRSSFVIDSEQRVEKLLAYILEQLSVRKNARAKVAQTTHIVWDLSSPMPVHIRQELTKLAEATGLSVLLIGEKTASKPAAEKSRPDPQAEPLTS